MTPMTRMHNHTYLQAPNLLKMIYNTRHVIHISLTLQTVLSSTFSPHVITPPNMPLRLTTLPAHPTIKRPYELETDVYNHGHKRLNSNVNPSQPFDIIMLLKR
jgi:hypothetical protein